MTDIRQHLPLILQALRRPQTCQDGHGELITRLRALLPSSYGLGTGCLVATSASRSLPLDVIIYDKTLPAPLTDLEAGLYDARQVLAVLMLTTRADEQELRGLLQTIASAKELRHYQPQEGSGLRSAATQAASSGSLPRPATRLKRLLPLGLIALDELSLSEAEGAEACALRLDSLLKGQPAALRPDVVLLHTRQLSYLHPLLNGGEELADESMNIVREPALKKPRSCYVCKQVYTHTHFFYAYLCPRCGNLNYRKRAIPLDLTGRIALVTGARVKIGYATALRLLRAGATVIATTRFPHDAARRYSQEPDFATWRERLRIYGLDFRYLPVLEHFVGYLSTAYSSLDILINNAAQTVRRPPDYYAPLLPYEGLALTALPAAEQELVRNSHAVLPPLNLAPGQLAQQNGLFALPTALEAPTLPTLYPHKAEDLPEVGGQNSWTLPFNQIDLTEFLEVQTINVTSPFLLISQLHPLLCRSPWRPRFIINVSAIEGQFASSKRGTHVHTNMAKASLNMLTHTAAASLVSDDILMNSVDPGWISQQAPQASPAEWERLQQRLPLDLLDAAARVCDPIFSSLLTQSRPAGIFYKDYGPASW